MVTKNVTLRVNKRIYDKYRLFCKIKGWIVSRKFEIMMENQMDFEKKYRV